MTGSHACLISELVYEFYGYFLALIV